MTRTPFCTLLCPLIAGAPEALAAGRYPVDLARGVVLTNPSVQMRERAGGVAGGPMRALASVATAAAVLFGCSLASGSPVAAAAAGHFGGDGAVGGGAGGGTGVGGGAVGGADALGGIDMSELDVAMTAGCDEGQQCEEVTPLLTVELREPLLDPVYPDRCCSPRHRTPFNS